jgi:hypothetical protein
VSRDPFGTAAVRERVLAGWAASTARFREDANAEDDLVRGGYRDRVVVELAQNAADAAARAGVAGVLSLRLDGDLLLAANTGAPLDAAGVESLCTLRASTKRTEESSAGRFGVGFAAVLAVTDAPRIASTTGAVRWDAGRAAAEIDGVPALAGELARRGGQLPVLRLPYAAPDAPPAAATTVVELPLRDAAARELVVRLLAEVDETLLLALPALERVDLDVDGATRSVTATGRWQVVRRTGSLDPHLLADRPVEERDRPGWSLTWARPLDGRSAPAVLHAPTPTDEPLDLPALLVGTFPLDPTRRHVAPGPLTDHLVAEAAAAYVELVLEVGDPADRWGLVPGPVAVGRLDGALRAAVLDALGSAPVLRTVAAGGEEPVPVAPREAVSVVGAGPALAAALADVVAGLVEDDHRLAVLGARRLSMADAVDLLADVGRAASWWHRLYAALAADGPLAGTALDALGALPVPLADGRLVRGARGALLPGPGLPAGLTYLGVRTVHPDAAHPMLARLGAAVATPRTVLDRPEVRAAVDAAWDADADGAAAVADAVLGLVAAAGLRPGELRWLSRLVLADDRGRPAAADELVLPGSVLAGLVDPDDPDDPDGSDDPDDPDGADEADGIAPVGAALVDRWGGHVLAAAGVLGDLTVVELRDLTIDPALAEAAEDDAGVPGLADWLTWVGDRVPRPGGGPAAVPPTVRTLAAVPELDVVGDGGWAALLEHVAADPGLRVALTTPVAVDLGGGGRLTVASYAAWFLRTHARLDGRSPTELAVAGSGLTGLWDELTGVAVDDEVLRAAGVRTGLGDLLADPDGASDLLRRLADPGRGVDERTLRAAYGALAGADPATVPPPETVRVDPVTVLPADRVVVVTAPHHLQVRWPDPPLVLPLGWAGRLADVLDLDTSTERLPAAAPDGTGVVRPVPDEVRRLLPAAPDSWQEHDDLTVGGDDVTWWVDDAGTVHAATTDGLARGLAWAAGDWAARWPVAALLEEPARAAELMTESLLEDDPPRG